MLKDNQMLALKILEPGMMRVEQVPHIVPMQNLNLQILASTICGSDLKILAGEMEGIKYPLIPGHEWVAKVIEAPKEYQYLVRKRIVPDILCCCNLCRFCKEKLPNLCDELEEPGLTLPGGFAEFTSIKPENAYTIPECISDLEAPLLEPLAVALYALERVNISNEDTVLIIGGGGIGQLIGQCTRLANPKNIILLDHHEFRLKLAKSLFANIALHGQNDNVNQFFVDNSKFKPTKIFEVTGSEKGIRLAITAAQKNAEIAIVGYSGQKTIGIKTSEIMVKHLTIKGVLSPTNTLLKAINLVTNNKINLKPIVTHTFKLEEAPLAFEKANYYKHEAIRVAILS
ncbi:zinc-dependent alcohol dehydrogenase [Rickettsia tamurae]|uniref:L-threonine 3-dehydrogenase n=1 Tax=Rickettsia tamurae subsp. buchneri TaxID=1462938 RepID=A0A8E0WNA0_9RICK|nr:alcohol dehydrogenase catalytic domain-containing protein [Rickettsia tamurae]KDO03402.1 L-threonine 3-dehydrogenase [Rickettsia tamurae subsp. buchneri]